MPFSFDAGELDGDFFSDIVPTSCIDSREVNPASDCKSSTSDAVGGVGGETIVLKDLKSIDKREVREKPFSPPTPLTAAEQAFLNITGHLPGDAWEGELPDDHIPDGGQMVDFDGLELCRSIPWPEVMQAAAEERGWGRKSTLALMYPHHEGRFEWYEHPITKKWHSYAAFPN